MQVLTITEVNPHGDEPMVYIPSDPHISSEELTRKAKELWEEDLSCEDSDVIDAKNTFWDDSSSYGQITYHDGSIVMYELPYAQTF